MAARADVPAQGMLTLIRSDAVAEAEAISDLVLENDLIRYEFAANGEILKAFDKEDDIKIMDIAELIAARLPDEAGDKAESE